MELAAVGVSIAVFNQVSKIAIIPLVSVTTSFVAEEDANERLSMEADDSEVLKKSYAVDLEMEMKELIPQVGVPFLFSPPLVFVKVHVRSICHLMEVPISFKFFSYSSPVKFCELVSSINMLWILVYFKNRVFMQVINPHQKVQENR